MSLNNPWGRKFSLMWQRSAVRWIPATLWAGAIFAVSSVPGSSLPPGSYAMPGHFTAYAILGALVYIALRPGRPRRTAMSLAIIAASLYGASDELHQAFVPGRTPDIADWGLDTLGAAAGVLAMAFGERRILATRRNDEG